MNLSDQKATLAETSETSKALVFILVIVHTKSAPASILPVKDIKFL